MKIKILTLVLAANFGLLGIPTASAITFNFNTATGDLGFTHTYDSTPPSGFTVTADGFMTTASFAGSLVGASPSDLFGKANPGDEQGLGLPGLVVACGALIALARRRRQRIA
jgi:hypothetical protein